MFGNNDKFFSGLVAYIHDALPHVDESELRSVHLGTKLALDYFELTISSGESNTSMISEEFQKHVDIFYANPEETAV